MELGMICDVWWRGLGGALLEMNVPGVISIDWHPIPKIGACEPPSSFLIMAWCNGQSIAEEKRQVF